MISHRNGRAAPIRACLLGLVVAGAALTAACSGNGSSTLSPAATPSPGSASLPAAIATGCIGASPANQTAPLPSAGGMSGTIEVGPVTAAPSGCAVSVQVATGADARLSTANVAARVRRAAEAQASPLPSPIAQVELSTTTSSASWLAVSLTLPSSVPAGSYPATITTTVDLGDGQTYTQTFDYTLTVAPNGTAALTGINVTFGNYSAGLLSIYPKGTVLPTPAPTPTASPTSAPSASATPTAAPSTTPPSTPLPTATPSFKPTPSPTPSTVADCYSQTALVQCGSYVSSGYYDGPQGYYSPSPAPGTSSPQPLYNQSQQGNPQGTVFVPYYWFVGTVTISLPYYAPGYQQQPVNDCPSTTSLVQSGHDGDTYTVTFPGNGAQYALGPNGTDCLIYIEAPSDVDEPSYVLDLTYPGGTIVPTIRKPHAVAGG